MHHDVTFQRQDGPKKEVSIQNDFIGRAVPSAADDISYVTPR